MYDLRRVDLRTLFALMKAQKGRMMQKFIRNSYVICQDEDFAIEEHDDGTYDLVLQVVRADGDGVRAELIVSMTAIELAKLGEHIEETTAGMETALVRQQEHVERTLDYLRHRHHDNGNGEGTGSAPRR